MWPQRRSTQLRGVWAEQMEESSSRHDWSLLRQVKGSENERRASLAEGTAGAKA